MIGTFAPHHGRTHMQALALPGGLLAWCEISRSGRRAEWCVTDAAGQPVAHGSDRIPWPWTAERRAEAMEARMGALERKYREKALTA